MTEEAKQCVQYCREWYQAFTNKGRGDEPTVKEFLEVADLIESLSAELEQVKRERDAAVEDLSDHGMLCVLCMHENKAVDEEPCKSCSHASTVNRHTNWQWRGVKEEE